MNIQQKQTRIERARRHVELDRLVSGSYVATATENGTPRGCSVGCDAIDIQMAAGVAVEGLKGDNCHAIVAAHDGTPVWLERLRDVIFEELPPARRSWWHVALAESLPITDDWEPYRHTICAAILRHTLKRAESWPDSCRQQVVAAIEQTIAYHDSTDWTESARSAAESAAESARSAAWSAAESARSAAWSAAESAKSAVESVGSTAWSAAESVRFAAWSATESARSAAEYEYMAETIVRTLRVR